MSVAYDTITGDTELISYVSSSAPNYGIYPTSNVVAVTGPMWLPKVYGKDLTAFEIASSGKIALTISDVHSLDLYNRVYGDGSDPDALITGINTKSNYAFEMSTSNKDIKIYMDSYSNDLYVYAQSNIYIDADGKDMVITAGQDTKVITDRDMYFTASNGSLDVNVNAGNFLFTLDKDSSNATLYSSKDVTVDAKNDFTLSASNDLWMSAWSNIDVTASHGSFNLSADQSNFYVLMDHVTKDTTVYSKGDYDLTASNSYIVKADSNVDVSGNKGFVSLTAGGENTYLTLNAAGDSNSVSLYAKSNLTVSVSNNTSIESKSNVSVTAALGHLGLSAVSGNVTFDMTTDRNAVLFADNDFKVSACNDVDVTADVGMTLTAVTGSFGIHAHNNAMYLTLDHTTDNAAFYVGNDLTETVGGDATHTVTGSITNTASTGSYSVSAHSGAMTLTMDSATNTTTVYTQNDYKLTACNDYLLDVKRTVDITAGTGSFLVDANSGAMTLTMDHVTNATSFYTAGDYSVTAGANLSMDVTSNVTVKSTAGSVYLNSAGSNVYISLEKATSNLVMSAEKSVDVTADSNMVLWARSNVYVTACNGEYDLYAQQDLWMRAHNDNIYIKMNYIDDSINIYGRTNTSLVSSNLYMTLCNDMTVDAAASVSYTATNFSVNAVNSVDLTADYVDITARKDITYGAQSNFNFKVAASPDDPNQPVFTIGPNIVQIRGDMVITGSINTSNIINTTVIQENLRISDKLILLANSGSNADPAPFDGYSTNDGSGIQIDGVPSGVDSNEFDLHRKYIKWNYGEQGTLAIGTSNYTESYWEVEGGSLRITRHKNNGSVQSPDIKQVSFSFKINDRDELEFYKTYWDVGSNLTKSVSVARFGRFT